MDIAALIIWIATAGGGFFLLGTWLAKGGIRHQQEGRSRFSPGLVFGHPVLAATGLVVWIAYLVSDNEALAWTALALLVVIAGAGFAMFIPWLRDRRVATTTNGQPAEQHLPSVVVFAHGALAVATVVVVLLAALDAGS